MPHATEEESKDSQPNRSPFNIAAWWRKFHFSGRVIACSVLLGLGLVLIGGLIFAINLTDNNKSDNDRGSDEVPTKAPSNFTGPVVMGIGGFIVTIGVIMCLFETQVCRKRTGDSSPLISEKTDDPERKGSDSAPGPSTSDSHKSHGHGSRKTCASPRKSKSRHAKSRSKERNQQKSTSPKTPPVPIQPSKSFMTSSEENFLTPPNTLDESVSVAKNYESHKAEATHSAIMKSFTSSEPSWNQSTEFLTPSTSFRDSSVSLNNSVEIDKNQENNLKDTELSENINSEYVTPLTVEEDRIQQLLIRVKNEQKQKANSKKETKVGSSEYSKLDDNNTSSSQAQMEIVKKDNEGGDNFEKENNSSNKLLLESTSASKNVNEMLPIQMENALGLSNNEHDTSVSERNLDEKDVHNETVNDISDKVINDAKVTISSPQNVHKDNISFQNDSRPLINENKDHALVLDSDKGASHRNVQGNDVQADLESSVSSDETVVSPDNFQENLINKGSSSEEATLSTLEENLDEESKHLGTSESLEKDSIVVNEYSEPYNQESFPHRDEAGAQDLYMSKNDDDKVVADEIENVLKDASS